MKGPADYVVIVRALDADTKAAISGLDVRILDGPRAGNGSSSPSDQLPLSLPSGRVTLRVSAIGHEPGEVVLDVSGAALVEVPVLRSSSPGPSPTPSPSQVTVSGVVRAAATGRGIANARVEVIGGADDGRATSTDVNGAYRLDNLRDSARRMMASAPDYAGQSFDVAGTTVNFDLMSVRDGRGQTSGRRGVFFDVGSPTNTVQVVVR
jgi:hypothetical protein